MRIQLKCQESFFDEYKEKMKTAANNSLEKTINEMLERSPNPRHKYNYLSLFSSLIDAANDIVAKEDIDIIVMGTKGKTDDRNITFGSQTLQVIKYVKCPVLAIPNGYHDRPPKNILFPSDYLVPYKKRELKLVSTIAKDFGATLNFLHVSRSKSLSHRQLDNRSFLDSCTADNKPTFLNIKGNDVTNSIDEFIKEYSINFLVMVNSRHSYMENLLHESTIDKIGLNIEIPFLVLQNLPR